MINPLNELSAVYLQNIAEESPEEQSQKITQIVKAIRYRARKEGVEVSKAYNDYIGSVQATATERQIVKEKLGLTGGSTHKEEVEIEESGVGYEAGKPATKMGAVSGISKSEQEAARERIKAKMAARKKMRSGSPIAQALKTDDKIMDLHKEETAEEIAERKGYSNWRSDLIEVIDNSYDISSSQAKTSDASREKIKDKKVNNKVIINPPMKEAIEELGGTLIEMSEVEEGIGMTMANAMGNPPVLSKRMKIKQSLLKREVDKNTEKNKMKKYSGKAASEEQTEEVDQKQMQQIQRRQIQLDRKKLQLKQQAARQGQETASDSTITSEGIEHINEMPYQVMGYDKEGGKEKKVGKPVKSKKYADARASELSDTHKKTGGKYRSQYVEDVEQVDEVINMKKADMGDVVKDFYKSDAPQFKGKSKEKRRQMAIAAKLEAERGPQKEEVNPAIEDKFKKAKTPFMMSKFRKEHPGSRQPKKTPGAKPTEGELNQQRIRKANERIRKHGLTSKEKGETKARAKYDSARD